MNYAELELIPNKMQNGKAVVLLLFLLIIIIIVIVVTDVDVVLYFSHKVYIWLALLLSSFSSPFFFWFSCVSYRDGLGISSSHFFYVFSHVKLNLTYCSAVTNTPQAQIHTISITIFIYMYVICMCIHVYVYMCTCICVCVYCICVDMSHCTNVHWEFEYNIYYT